MYSFETFFVVYCVSLILFFSMLPKRKNIIESQKKRIINTVLSKIYCKYSKFHFPIMSKFPLLNFAFPDNSVEYYIMSMEKNKTIRIRGIIPNDKIKYFSITFYDTVGNIIYSRNDSNLPKYYNLKVNSYQDVCMIIRFYKKKQYQHDNFSKHLPDVLPKRTMLPKKKIIQNSRYVQKLLLQHIETNPLPIEIDTKGIHFFMLPSKESIHSMYVNKDAVYLVALPYTMMGKITLSKINLECSFIGFMCSNYKTSQTDSSFSISRERKIHVWFCQKKNIALLEKFGYRKNHDALITWKNQNQYPILIYREVNVHKSRLKSIRNKKTHYRKEKLLPIMGDYYPMIEYF